MFSLTAQEYVNYAGNAEIIMKFEAPENTILKKCFSQNEMNLVGRLGCLVMRNLVIPSCLLPCERTATEAVAMN